MKYFLSAAMAMALALLATPSRADITAFGVTYSLSATGLDTSTASFDLHITGINAAADTEGGRASVHSFALNQNPLPDVGSGLSGTTTGGNGGTFIIQQGGLNSGGCDGSGNFFCFNNTSALSSPALTSNSTIDILFSLTLTSGDFLAWVATNPSFKIDWLGTKTGGYDLVSQPGTGLTVTTHQVPAPIVGAGLPGLIAACAGLWAFARRRRQKFA